MKKLLAKLKLYGPQKFLYFLLIETKRKLYYQWLLGSFSQNGEDLIIDKALSHKGLGFYVDVGANDPHRFSNTKRFYQRDWRGINIEPDVVNFQKLAIARPRDINLNLGVGKEEGELTFYEIFPDTLSTFSQSEAEKRKAEGHPIVRETKVPVDTLANVLAEHLGDNAIDFLSIDTEGFDLIVLQSNDWQKYRPKVICQESTAGAESFLSSLDYQKKWDNGTNSLYVSHEKI